MVASRETLVLLAHADLVPRVIAERIAPEQVRFSFTAPDIGYLRDYDPALRAGTLAVWIPGADREFVVASGVREFREVRWPEVGVLYTIPDDGLWFLSLVEALRDG